MDWFSADHHFGHGNILPDGTKTGMFAYENRAFDTWIDMDNFMIEVHNSKVDHTRDKSYFLGDFSFHGKAETKSIMERMSGRKILILGNHDRARSRGWWLDAGFEQVIEFPIIYKKFFILSHEPVYLNEHMPYANLHGHLHSKRLDYKGYYNVGVDLHGYSPLTLDEIKAKMGLPREPGEDD